MRRNCCMDGLTSTAIYLASSLTTAQAPHMVVAMPTITVTISTPTAAGDIKPPIDVLVSVNPFAAARSRGGKSLSVVIADEVRRDALDHPTDDRETASSLDPERSHGEDQSLSEDVTAAHDARIDFIRQRMDALRLEGTSAAPMLDRLGTKLHMAMAARRLAVAREAIGQLPIDCSLELDVDACRPAPVAVAANAATGHLGSRYAQLRRSSASHHKTSTTMLAASIPSSSSDKVGSKTAGRPFGVGVRHTADIHRDPAHRTPDHFGRPSESMLLAAWKAARHDPVQSATGDASDHARRLLAAARRLLEDGTDHRPRPDIKLAGLLHWEGSETWSLAAYPRSTI